jgi:hypothetical protein
MAYLFTSFLYAKSVPKDQEVYFEAKSYFQTPKKGYTEQDNTYYFILICVRWRKFDKIAYYRLFTNP